LSTFWRVTILSFDLEEWQRHWQKELPSHFDILDLGYWYSADNGEPKFAEPDATWRKDIAEGLLKQEKAEADAGMLRPGDLRRPR
jgi:hypothetical protein